MRIQFKLAMACLYISISTIRAQTVNEYYVDGSLPTNGNGTAASPWNKIWYSVNRTRDTTKDEIVYIKRGTYTIDSTNFLTQLFIGPTNGGANGKYFTMRAYPGDEGKVIIDGSKLKTNPFHPNMVIVSGAKYVKIQYLRFRSLKNTSGYVLNIQNAQNIEITNCAFDTLRWTNSVAEYGYPTVNNASNFIHAVYLVNNVNVTLANDTLRNSSPGWGEFVRDAGGNTGVTKTALISSSVIPVASNYYVALTGHDTTGSGSLTKPWRSLKKANEFAGINYTYVPSKVIDAPVTVYLRAGTHKPLVNGIFIGSNRGTNNQWFTIRNYPGENPVVDGSRITAKFSALISITDAKFIRVEGLKLTKMTNDSSLQNVAPSVGIKDTRFGIIVSGISSNIIIKKNQIFDLAWTRTLVKQKIPAPNDNLNPLVILGTTDISLRNVVIDSNTVYNNVTGWAEAISINGNVDSFAITNNLVFDNANIGIVAAGNYQWLVDDINFTVTAPFNFSKNGFIMHNTVYRNISPIAVSAGIYLDGSTNVRVEYNESYNNGAGLSVGNEQPNSSSGGHTIINNVFRDNLTAGMYYGSNHPTSMVQNCLAKWNTIQDNYIIDPVLRARANNQYGITNASQRYTELNVYRLQNSVFEENEILSLSNIVVGYFFAQSNLTFRYNEYYVMSGNACQAVFVQDKNNDGFITAGVDSIYSSFHQYAKKSGYDQLSICEGQSYNPNGCGTTAVSTGGTGSLNLSFFDNHMVDITTYPNPFVNNLFVTLNLNDPSDVNLQMMDISGKILTNQNALLPKGHHQIEVKGIDRHHLAPGTYVLKITTPNEIKTIKLTKP